MPSPYASLWHRLTERCVDNDGDCWIGIDTAGADRCGYQQIDVFVPGLGRHNNMGRRRVMAHVAAFCWHHWGCTSMNELWLAYRELRESGLELDHLCETPACRNPAHLEPRTPTDHRQVTLDRRAPRGAVVDAGELEF